MSHPPIDPTIDPDIQSCLQQTYLTTLVPRAPVEGAFAITTVHLALAVLLFPASGHVAGAVSLYLESGIMSNLPHTYTHRTTTARFHKSSLVSPTPHTHTHSFFLLPRLTTTTTTNNIQIYMVSTPSCSPGGSSWA